MPCCFTTACTVPEGVPAMKNELKVLRASRQMTQQQLAQQVGVSRQTIHAMETGRYVPSTVLALKVAHVFGRGVDEVFFLEEED